MVIFWGGPFFLLAMFREQSVDCILGPTLIAIRIDMILQFWSLHLSHLCCWTIFLLISITRSISFNFSISSAKVFCCKLQEVFFFFQKIILMMMPMLLLFAVAVSAFLVVSAKKPACEMASQKSMAETGCSTNARAFIYLRPNLSTFPDIDRDLSLSL